MSIGKSVRLFLADGTPGGLLTAEIVNWTGHVTSVSRSELRELLKRDEANRTGIYILIGDDPEGLGGEAAYIGEGDVIGVRLRNHHASQDKDFWNRAIVLSSKDSNLTKSHARYLESRFISLGNIAGRARILNSTSPPPPPLPESDISDMEYFIEQAKIVLPVLNVNIFRSAATAQRKEIVGDVADSNETPEFYFNTTIDGIKAHAQEIDGEFTVLAGSRVRHTWIGESHNYRGLRERLEADGTLELTPDDSVMMFTRNHVFSSPSAAAAVVVGRVSNGRQAWTERQTGLSYGEWQSRSLDEDLNEFGFEGSGQS